MACALVRGFVWKAWACETVDEKEEADKDLGLAEVSYHLDVSVSNGRLLVSVISVLGTYSVCWKPLFCITVYVL